MPVENVGFGCDEFIALNQETEVNELDYLRIIFDISHLHPDFIVSVARLFHPEFKIIEGCAFSATAFSQNKFNRMHTDGMSVEDIQYWANLIEITGLFPTLDDHQAVEIAHAIVECWNHRLSQYEHAVGLARVIVDSELGEIFVSISKKK
jgi:hypothetical protein